MSGAVSSGVVIFILFAIIVVLAAALCRTRQNLRKAREVEPESVPLPQQPKPITAPGIFLLDDAQMAVFDAIERGGNFFIQGQAGTGKSNFISFLKAHSGLRKDSICVACYTGLAALNVGGVTLHSLFQFPLTDFFDLKKLRMGAGPAQMLRDTNLLIIDEVSMVRPDMLDAIDLFAKQARRTDAPFGGMQIVLMGDLLQLPPVVTDGVKDSFRKAYGYAEPFFFDAPAFKNGGFKAVAFTKIYRQADAVLLNNLNAIRARNDNALSDAIGYFNSLQLPDREKDKAVTMTATRTEADTINAQRLAVLPGSVRTYQAVFSGSFVKPQKNADDKLPAPISLHLKVGALVLVVRNLTPQCVNGSSAMVTALRDGSVDICLLDTGLPMTIAPVTWDKYGYDKNNELVKKGSYTQIPLQLGYAMTVHKAQGKTLDKAIICTQRAFAAGQAYVALSRTRRAQDIHMAQSLKPSDIIVDQRAVSFLARNNLL